MHAAARPWPRTLPSLAQAEPTVDAAAAADAALVAAAQRDPAAFDALYRRHLRAVYRYAYARCGSPADAEDIAAAVFIEALTALPRYEERGTFLAWLFTIARRQVGAHRRRERGRSFDSLDALAAGRSSPADPQDARLRQQQEEHERLARAMGRLSPDQRDALQLRFYGGLMVVEIGQAMGKGESAVKMLLHRGLRQLRAILDAEEADSA